MVAIEKTIANVLKSIAPMYYTCRIFGLLPINRRSTRNFFYFFSYFILYTSTSSYNLYRVIFEEIDFKPTIKVFAMIEWSLIVILETSTLICSYIFREKFSIIINELTEVDVHLNRYNVPVKYNAILKTTVKLSILTYFSTTINAALFLMSAGILSDLDALEKTVLYISTVFRSLIKYQFVIFLVSLRDRYRTINTAIRCLYESTRKSPLLFSVEEVKSLERKAEILYVMCRMHYKLSGTSRLVNGVFSLQILCSLGISMYNILYQSYRLYIIFSGKADGLDVYEISSCAVWLMLELSEVYVLVAVCDSTSEYAKEIATILHELRNTDTNSELDNQIQMYSLQMLHQHVEFSALGFFVMNYSLLYSIIGAVATYLVIFIQFDQTPTNNVNNITDAY